MKKIQHVKLKERLDFPNKPLQPDKPNQIWIAFERETKRTQTMNKHQTNIQQQIKLKNNRIQKKNKMNDSIADSIADSNQYCI